MLHTFWITASRKTFINRELPSQWCLIKTSLRRSVVSERAQTQATKKFNIWTIPYLLHAYDVKRSTFIDKRALDKQGATQLTTKKRVQYNKGDCVITDRTASRRKYSDKYFFARTKALAWTIPTYTDEGGNDSPDAAHRQPEWRKYPHRVSYLAPLLCD